LFGRKIVREHDGAIGVDLDEPWPHRDAHLGALLDVTDDARLERSEERPVTRENAELAVDARSRQRLNLFLENDPFGSHDLEIDLALGHRLYDASFRRWAWTFTSSMPPFM